MGLRVANRRNRTRAMNWAKFAILGVGVSLACAACSREESSPSSKPKSVSGSDPLSYATDSGGGGSASGGWTLEGSGGSSFFRSGGGDIGGGGGDGSGNSSSGPRGLRHKNLDGTDGTISTVLPPEPAADNGLLPQVTLQVPQSLVDAVGSGSSASPYSGDPLPGVIQVNASDDSPSGSAAPLPSVVWAGLALICAIPLLTAIAARRERRITIAQVVSD